MIDALDGLRQALDVERESCATQLSALAQENAALLALFEGHPSATLVFDLSSLAELFARMDEADANSFASYAQAHPRDVIAATCGARLVDANAAAFELLDVRDFHHLTARAAKIFGPALLEAFALFASALWRGETGFSHEMALRDGSGAPIGVTLSARAPGGPLAALGPVAVTLTRDEAVEADDGSVRTDAAALLRLAGELGVLKRTLSDPAQIEEAGRLQRAVLAMILRSGDAAERAIAREAESAALASSAETRPALPAPAARADATVLVITDLAEGRPVIAGVLAGLGVRHAIARRGGDGLTTAAVGAYAMAILDAAPGGAVNPMMARAFRALGGAAVEMPVIALASMAGDARWRFIEAGCDGVITRPVDPDAIAREVRRWCGESAFLPADASASEAAEKTAHDLAREAA